MSKWWKRVLRRREEPGRIRYYFGTVRRKKGGLVPMIQVSCTNEQKIPVAVAPVTAVGNPASIQAGSLSVTVQSGEGTVAMIDDSSFELISGANPGDTVYLVAADADLGDGVQTISDIVTLHVEGALAASLGLVVGEALPK